jgi:fluoride exporter
MESQLQQNLPLNMAILKSLMWVGLGGMLGSCLRYAVGSWLTPFQWPVATFVVNISGSFLMGLLMGYFARTGTHDNLKWLLVTGFCGGFTTFSAFAWENFQLLQQGRYVIFVTYTGGTILLGLFAVALGYQLMK